MTRLVVESRVDEEGVLKLTVPVGKDEANRTMRITIEPAGEDSPSQLERQMRLSALIGSWQGDFEEPEELPYEERDSLP